MAKKTQEPLYDHLGRDLAVGMPVIFFHRARKCMQVGRVWKLSRVNVNVKWTGGKFGDDWRSVRASDVSIVDEAAYVFNFMRTGIG